MGHSGVPRHRGPDYGPWVKSFALAKLPDDFIEAPDNFFAQQLQIPRGLLAESNPGYDVKAMGVLGICPGNRAQVFPFVNAPQSPYYCGSANVKAYA